MTSTITTAASIAYQNNCHQSNIKTTKIEFVIMVIMVILTIRFIYKNWEEIKKF